MKKTSQADENPFVFSDSNKRYHTYDYYLRRTFGGKCAKISLDCGLGCPDRRRRESGREDAGERDGTFENGSGCIFCEYGGQTRPDLPPIEEQYRAGREKISSKWAADRCIAYLSAGTNTNAPLPVLRDLYSRALRLPGVVGMNIATRADCLPQEVIKLLDEFSRKTVLTVELGMQTSHDVTAAVINRGYNQEEFLAGYHCLRAAGGINICLHLIFGLPGENAEMMLRSVCAAAALRPGQIKLHMLYVAPGTPLARMCEADEYTPLKREEYVDLVCRAIELIPPETVICRLTGDGPAGSLPEWARRKIGVINDIDKLLYEKKTYQGRQCIVKI